MDTFTYKGYQGQFEYDHDAHIFHGDVLLTKDVATFQGRTVDELQQAFIDSIEDYLAFCHEHGKEPNNPADEIPS